MDTDVQRSKALRSAHAFTRRKRPCSGSTFVDPSLSVQSVSEGRCRGVPTSYATNIQCHGPVGGRPRVVPIVGAELPGDWTDQGVAWGGFLPDAQAVARALVCLTLYGPVRRSFCRSAAFKLVRARAKSGLILNAWVKWAMA